MNNFFSQIKIEKYEWLLVTGLLLLAFLFRFYNLAELMPYTYDQGRDMAKLQEIGQGDLTLVGPTTGIGGVFLGPLYFYFLLPGFILSGGNPVGVMYWLTTWVTLSLIFVYLILKRMFSVKWAIFGLFLFAINPGSINEARVIWNPSLAAPLLLASWYFLFKSSERSKYFIPPALAFALSLQTELAYTIFFTPLYGLWMLYFSPLWWIIATKFSLNRPHKPYSWKTLVVSMALSAMTLLPQIAFEIKNQFLMTNSYLQEMSLPERKTTLTEIWKYRPYQIAETVQEIVWGMSAGSFYWFVALIAVTMWLTTSVKLSKEEKFLTASFILPIFGLMMHTGNYGFYFSYYLNPHYLPALLVLIIAAARLPWKIVAASAIVMISLSSFYHISKIIYSSEVLQYTYGRQVEALSLTRALRTQDNYAVEVFVPNLQPVQYRYLNQWLSESGKLAKADFFRHEHPEYFLIYEPAYDDGSKVAFKEWYSRHTAAPGTRCEFKEKLGIITVEHCFR